MSEIKQTKPEENVAVNFIRNQIVAELAENKFSSRLWDGKPALKPQANQADQAKIRTRFPPEPNGYLHFGHAKSICLNFSLAADFAGACHLRFDDTNPEKEDEEYVKSIIDAVSWLGFSWQFNNGEQVENNLYYASDYFPQMIACAEKLITAELAYVDSQSPEAIKAQRGSLTEAGQNSPFRQRSVSENLQLFTRMQKGEFAKGEHVLRAKIDMASPNINLRDPAIYRIIHAEHHRCGNKYFVYPMYTFAHPIEDALENITHSLCTLEFEDQRPFYDWLLTNLQQLGCFQLPLPRQIEFSRLNLSYVVLSKRKLLQLINDGYVDGWDDPRMPTLVAAKRRGYPAQGLRLFCERLGISKSESLIEYSQLEDCMRTVLNENALRRIAVLNPIRLIVNNLPDDYQETCHAPNHPQNPQLGQRPITFTRELWIDRDDFMASPSKGYHRLYPGNLVRLRYAYVVKCLDYQLDDNGQVTTVFCEYLPQTRSGTAGAGEIKVKGNIHWLSISEAHPVELRLYDRLFTVPNPRSAADDDNKILASEINANSCLTCQAQVEPCLLAAPIGECYQFERYGYFTADSHDSLPNQPVFNRTVGLRDTWQEKI